MVDGVRRQQRPATHLVEMPSCTSTRLSLIPPSALTEALRTARCRPGEADGALSQVAHAYSNFAAENPVWYDAMFTRVTWLRFGAGDTPAQLRAGFAELREAVASVAGGQGVDTLTEVLWAALHGLTTLGRSGRLRPGYDAERIEVLVAQFYDAARKGPVGPQLR